jgi:hypothetical protein
VAHRNHQGDIVDRDFPAAVAEIEVDLVDFVGDLAGLGTGPLDEELESLTLDAESLLAGDPS